MAVVAHRDPQFKGPQVTTSLFTDMLQSPDPTAAFNSCNLREGLVLGLRPRLLATKCDIASMLCCAASSGCSNVGPPYGVAMLHRKGHDGIEKLRTGGGEDDK